MSSKNIGSHKVSLATNRAAMRFGQDPGGIQTAGDSFLNKFENASRAMRTGAELSSSFKTTA